MGLLKDLELTPCLPAHAVGYSNYGLSDGKQARLWNNVEQWSPRPRCQKDCESMVEGGKHRTEQAQRLPTGKRETWGENYRKIPREELYVVPAPLILEIMSITS